MINKVILLGHLGKAPEGKTTPGGVTMATFSVATSFKFKNQKDEWVDNTTWHTVRVWKNLADNCMKYLDKGSKVYIEGRINNYEYTDKEGIKRYGSNVEAREVKFLDPPKKKQHSPEPPGVAEHGYPDSWNTGEHDVPL